MTSLQYGPNDAYRALKLEADIINCPWIGTEDNFTFSTMQFNTSPAESARSGASLRVSSVARTQIGVTLREDLYDDAL